MPIPTTIRPTRTLRVLLVADGAGNAALGALILPLAGVLDAPTGLPAQLLTPIGAFYVLYGAAMWFTATRPHPRAAAILALIAVNPLWGIACLLLRGTDLAHPSTLGSVLLAAEAATVVVLAALQYLAYRRSVAPASPAPISPATTSPAPTSPAPARAKVPFDR